MESSLCCHQSAVETHVQFTVEAEHDKLGFRIESLTELALR